MAYATVKNKTVNQIRHNVNENTLYLYYNHTAKHEVDQFIWVWTPSWMAEFLSEDP
jgi:hypothetical protein